MELLPRGSDGWSSGQLDFGKVTTLLLGPNGAGKTPIIKALAYCFGVPVELPPLVRAKCRSVRVTLADTDGLWEIERELTDGVDAAVKGPTGSITTFNNERALSEWILPKLGGSLRTLAAKNTGKIPPYMSVVGPIFFIDQDTGWASAYMPFETHNFVKDQREEVIRWILGAPSKNRAIDKGEYQAAKIELASIQERVAFKRQAIEDLQRELGEDRAPEAAQRLSERQTSLEADLARAYSVVESLSTAESALDVRVREAVQWRDQVSHRAANAKRRKAQLAEVQAEVVAELGAVEQNEVAAEAFRAFCGNENCQFFRKPEESYGRRVLYLKDQLKDFESSAGETQRGLVAMEEQLAAAQAAVETATSEKTRSLDAAGAGTALLAVQSMAREVADIRIRLDRLDRIGREVQQLNFLLDRELRATETVAELRPTSGPRKDSTRLLDARQHLATSFKEWMLALRTPNVPADVVFDEELRLVIGGERFSAKSSLSGSTRTRIVLAFHAALVECSLVMKGAHPRLLVLDAPRQHELSADDLRSYLQRFYSMSASQQWPVQLVFSATDPEVVPRGHVDALWEPQFGVGEELRFLGPSVGQDEPPKPA